MIVMMVMMNRRGKDTAAVWGSKDKLQPALRCVNACEGRKAAHARSRRAAHVHAITNLLHITESIINFLHSIMKLFTTILNFLVF